MYEQEVRLSEGDGEFMRGWRITVELDKPTRHGETEVHILTNLPAESANVLTIAELYRKRWTVETDQADSTSSDRWCEATGAGYHRRRRAA